MMNKNLIIFSFLFFLLLSPMVVLAANPLGIGENLNIGLAVLNIAENVWFIFAGFAIVMFIWSGFIFLTAQGEPGKIATARQAVIWGIVGVAVALLSNSVLLIVKNLLAV